MSACQRRELIMPMPAFLLFHAVPPFEAEQVLDRVVNVEQHCTVEVPVSFRRARYCLNFAGAVTAVPKSDYGGNYIGEDHPALAFLLPFVAEPPRRNCAVVQTVGAAMHARGGIALCLVQQIAVRFIQ